jgi:hypothetical protein
MRAFSAGGAVGRPEHVLAPVAFLTFASVLPSIVSCVVDRKMTTAYIVQSAVYLLGLHATILTLELWHVSEYSVAITQTCLLHMLWSQFHTLERHKHVLIFREAVQILVLALGVLSWGACVLMMPHLVIDIFALGGLMFAGEVLGVAVSFVAGIIGCVGNIAESCTRDLFL